MMPPMRPVARMLIAAVALYASWLGMMAVHELGHVIHARLSGGVVAAVHVPMVGYSVTEYAVNPRPRFVAWGGAVWGSVLPLVGWGIARRVRMPGSRWLQFFAGFCLVANGAYLGVGWAMRVGDAQELLTLGTPRAALCAFGIVALTAGLLIWHDLGPMIPHKTKQGGPGWPAP
jgi:mannose/fructose/N-acetylgalactosamine-specific phosphotransferase system component IIC